MRRLRNKISSFPFFMPTTLFAILQCTNPDCDLRVPATADQRMDRCPRCHAPCEIAESFVSEEDVGRGSPASGGVGSAAVRRMPVHLVVDNVRSAFNVGSIFRSADGAGVTHLYLCGFTPTPEHPRVAKTSLGAEALLAWSAHANALAVVKELQAGGATIWALERNERSSSLWDTPLPQEIGAERPLVLVAGSEVTGVDPAIMRIADAVVELPMRGNKQSLNVAVACGVALTVLGERIARERTAR